MMMTVSFLDELFLYDLMLKYIKPNHNDECSILCKHNSENSCVYACVFIWLTNVTLPWRSQAGEVLILRCSVLWRGLIQLSSCHILQEHTHTAISQNAFQQNTQTHLNPMNPIFFFFSPLVYPPLLACLGSVLIFQHCLSICSSDPLEALAIPDAIQLSAGRAGHPTPLRATLTLNPNTLSHRRHKPSLPAQLARTPSLHQTRSGCRCQVLLQTRVVGVKMMEWNSTFQKSQSSSTCDASLVSLNILNMLLNISQGKRVKISLRFWEIAPSCELFCIHNV